MKRMAPWRGRGPGPRLHALCALLPVALVLFGCARLSVPRDPRTMSFEPLRFSPPRAERHVLDNGMVIFLLEDHEIPLVEGRALIRAGSVLDPPGVTGLASLCGELLVKGGTKALPGGMLDEVLEQTAITMGSSMGRQSGSVTLSVLSSRQEEGLGLLADVLRRPAFESGKLELARKARVEEIARLVDDPDGLTFREFRRHLYAGDPRGRAETSREVEGIRREDVEGFHRRYVHPDRIIVGFSGDFDPELMLGRLEALFGDWPASGEPPPSIPVPGEGSSDTFISLVDKDLPQATIVLGHLAPPRGSADYVPFMMANFILGEGGFNSRLMREIRSDRGLAYSVGSFYRGDEGYGVFASYVKTKNEGAPAVLQSVRDIIGDLKRSGVTSEELDWARESLETAMIFRFSSSAAILAEAMGLELDGLPPDHFERVADEIRRATIPRVNEAAGRWLRPEAATIVVLGNEAGFASAWPERAEVRRFRALPDGRIE